MDKIIKKAARSTLIILLALMCLNTSSYALKASDFDYTNLEISRSAAAASNEDSPFFTNNYLNKSVGKSDNLGETDRNPYDFTHAMCMENVNESSGHNSWKVSHVVDIYMDGTVKVDGKANTDSGLKTTLMRISYAATNVESITKDTDDNTTYRNYIGERLDKSSKLKEALGGGSIKTGRTSNLESKVNANYENYNYRGRVLRLQSSAGQDIFIFGAIKKKKPETGNLYIRKVDANGLTKRLNGAGFIIKDPDGKWLKEQNGQISYVSSQSSATEFITSNVDGNNGLIKIKGIKPGTYTIIETKAPSGYVISDKAKSGYTKIVKAGETAYVGTLLTDENGNQKTITIDGVEVDIRVIPNEEEKTTPVEKSIKVVKVDETSRTPLQGVKFRLTKVVNGTETTVGEKTTDANGEITWTGLEANVTYYVQETATLTGYELSTDKKTIKLTDSNPNQTVTITNKKKTVTPVEKSIKVIKIDETSRAKLQGVKFRLTKLVNGRETTVGERTTDANGEITWTGLEANVTYYVQETATLTDYELTTDKKTIKLTDSNPNQTITITNKKKTVTPVEKSIKVIKIDETSRAKLQGVKFRLTKLVNGRETTVGERTTDANGEITWTGLEANVTYYVQETATLTGYELSTDKKTIKLTDSNPNQTITITNKKKTYGKIKIIKVDKNNHSKKLSGAIFKVSMLKNGRETTLSGSPFTTNANGEILIENLDREATYYISEVTAPSGYKLANGRVTVSFANTTQEMVTVQIEDEPKTVNIKIVKVDKDNTSIRLAGAVFEIKKIKNGSTTNLGKFTTNANGEITLNNMETGAKYYIHEVSAPEYYDIVNGDETIDLTNSSNVNDNAEIVKTFQNKKQVIDISGFVWIDRATGKSSTRNNLYKQNSGQYIDSEDVLFKGVKVRLVDKNGKTIKETETNAQGEYKFSDVSAKDLVEGNYHVEFSYDGIKYEDVQKMNSNNGSKASEDYNSTYGKQTRDALNKKFGSVNGNGSMSNGYSTGYVYSSSNGNKSVSYLTRNNVAEVQNLDIDTTMTAETENNYLVTRYNNEIKSSNNSNKEIKYVNLGVYERDQADIAIATDLYNVKLGINGYQHVYNYNQVTVKNGNNVADEDAFNVGVKFSNKYNGNYKRAIYESDYTWKNDDTSKELKVYVTYEIALRNQSDGNLRAKINQISDYYDSNYTFVKAGTGINNGEITNEIKAGINLQNGNKNGYKRLVIDNINETSDVMNLSKDDKYIYIQFSVDRATVQSMLNSSNNTLNHVVEIDSYSITENGNPYATIDKDSAPGNCIPGDSGTYEDDTAYAKGLTLEVANARELNGKVFLDTTNSETNVGGERLGDGEYKQPEPGIKGVKVTYIENSGSGKVYDSITGNDGNYTISGFIPGNYTIIYTWGDDTYNVQDYKGTIFKEPNRVENKEWYKITEPRYSDAKDDYSTREKIDDEIANEGETTITQMNSVSPEMSVGVEYDNTTTASNGDRYTYAINNADFGIVERARQGINIGKKVTHIKLTLANGQVYGDSDVNIDNVGKKIDGKESNGIEPPIKGITMTKGDAEYPYGQIKAEIDNELIQGATIDITYEVIVENTSELDFANNNYYWYGTTKENKVTIKPTEVLDYLDEQMPFEKDKNNGDDSAWELIEKSTYETVKEKSELTLTEKWDSDVTQNPSGTKTIRVNNESTEVSESSKEEWQEIAKYARTERIKGRNILKSTANIGELEPGTNKTIGKLTASKVLSISDEIELNENHVEITKVEKNGGRRLSVVKRLNTSNSSNTWNDWAERIIVVPPTGENNNYLPVIIIGISVSVIFGTGIVLIKKKVLK